eukprot:scpid36871/ scgid16706/ 
MYSAPQQQITPAAVQPPAVQQQQQQMMAPTPSAYEHMIQQASGGGANSPATYAMCVTSQQAQQQKAFGAGVANALPAPFSQEYNQQLVLQSSSAAQIQPHQQQQQPPTPVLQAPAVTNQVVVPLAAAATPPVVDNSGATYCLQYSAQDSNKIQLAPNVMIDPHVYQTVYSDISGYPLYSTPAQATPIVYHQGAAEPHSIMPPPPPPPVQRQPQQPQQPSQHTAEMMCPSANMPPSLQQHHQHQQQHHRGNGTGNQQQQRPPRPRRQSKANGATRQHQHQQSQQQQQQVLRAPRGPRSSSHSSSDGRVSRHSVGSVHNGAVVAAVATGTASQAEYRPPSRGAAARPLMSKLRVPDSEDRCRSSADEGEMDADKESFIKDLDVFYNLRDVHIGCILRFQYLCIVRCKLTLVEYFAVYLGNCMVAHCASLDDHALEHLAFLRAMVPTEQETTSPDFYPRCKVQLTQMSNMNGEGNLYRVIPLSIEHMRAVDASTTAHSSRMSSRRSLSLMGYVGFSSRDSLFKLHEDFKDLTTNTRPLIMNTGRIRLKCTWTSLAFAIWCAYGSQYMVPVDVLYYVGAEADLVITPATDVQKTLVQHLQAIVDSLERRPPTGIHYVGGCLYNLQQPPPLEGGDAPIVYYPDEDSSSGQSELQASSISPLCIPPSNISGWQCGAQSPTGTTAMSSSSRCIAPSNLRAKVQLVGMSTEHDGVPVLFHDEETGLYFYFATAATPTTTPPTLPQTSQVEVLPPPAVAAAPQDAARCSELDSDDSDDGVHVTVQCTAAVADIAANYASGNGSGADAAAAECSAADSVGKATGSANLATVVVPSTGGEQALESSTACIATAVHTVCLLEPRVFSRESRPPADCAWMEKAHRSTLPRPVMQRAIEETSTAVAMSTTNGCTPAATGKLDPEHLPENMPLPLSPPASSPTTGTALDATVAAVPGELVAAVASAASESEPAVTATSPQPQPSLATASAAAANATAGVVEPEAAADPQPQAQRPRFQHKTSNGPNSADSVTSSVSLSSSSDKSDDNADSGNSRPYVSDPPSPQTPPHDTNDNASEAPRPENQSGGMELPDDENQSGCMEL